MARKLVASLNLASGGSGPWVDGNDNVYALCTGSSLGLRMYKAGTDPLVDSWTEQDTGNRPSTNATSIVGAWQAGDEIHVVAWDSTDTRYEYSVFRMSSHASADTWGTTNEIVNTPTDTPSSPRCFIAIRSESPNIGERIVFYNGDTEKVHGTDYERIYLARHDGTWTEDIACGDGAGDQANEYAAALGKGASDLMYFAYEPANANGLEFKTYNNSDALSEASGTSGTTITTAAITLYPRTDSSPFVAYYDDGGVEVMTFGYESSTANKISTRQTRDGTLQTEQDTSGTDVDATIPYLGLASDGTDLYVAYRDTNVDPTYQLNSDGAGWGDTTSFNAATAAGNININVIDHGGGKVLAVLYDDTDVYYDELSIAGSIVAVGLSSETDTAFAVDHYKTVQVGLSSETDTAFSVSPTKLIPAGLAAETDTSFTVGYYKTVQIGLASETDSVFSVAPNKDIVVGLANETDSAFTVSIPVIVAVGLASETDTALLTDHYKTIQVGLATETDTAFNIQPAESHLVGLATETDTALSIVPAESHTVGLSTEVNTAFVVDYYKTVQIGLASETDTAFVVTIPGEQIIPVGLANETDTALSIQLLRSYSIGLVTETDSALLIQPKEDHAVGLTSETDTAFVINHYKTVQVGLATEVDTAFIVNVSGETKITVGQATETDSALIVGSLKEASVNLTTETNTAFNTTPIRSYTIGLAVETDTAFSINYYKIVQVGLASEIDSAFNINVQGEQIINVGLASEVDTALPTGHKKTVPVGLVIETDNSLNVTVGGISVGLASEIDNSLSIIPNKITSIGLASETDLSLPITVEGIQIVNTGLASEIDNALSISVSLNYRIPVNLTSEIDTSYSITPFLYKEGITCLRNMLRTYLGDTDPSSYHYTNDELDTALNTSIFYVGTELKNCDNVSKPVHCLCDNQFNFNICDYPEFSTLVAIKAACLLDYGETLSSIKQSNVSAKCGPSSISIKSSDNLFGMILKDGACNTYDYLKTELCINCKTSIINTCGQICSVFSSPNYFTEGWK